MSRHSVITSGARNDITNADIAPIDDDHHVAGETWTQNRTPTELNKKKKNHKSHEIYCHRNGINFCEWHERICSSVVSWRNVLFHSLTITEGRINFHGKIVQKRWHSWNEEIHINCELQSKWLPQHKAAHSSCGGNRLFVSGLIAAIEETWKSRDWNKLILLHLTQCSVTNGGNEIGSDFSFCPRFPENGVKYIIYALMALIHTLHTS